MKTFGEQAALLEMRAVAIQSLCGTILATLQLNEKYFFRDDQPARDVFQSLLIRWKAELTALEELK